MKNKIKEICDWINLEKTLNIFKKIADTPSPSQIAPWTRGGLIESILKDYNVINNKNLNWEINFKNTHNGVIKIGRNSPDIALVAHWDTISYLIGEPYGDEYNLIPYCYHTMEERIENGLCLGYNLNKKEYEIICKGKIKGGKTPKFYPENNEVLKPGYRVVFNTPLNSVNNKFIYEGQIDNAAGCTAILLATIFLSKYSEINLISCFTDEEEGPVSDGNTAFSRGSHRILPYLDNLDLVYISDLHYMPNEKIAKKHIGSGAIISEFASKAKGAVTPPWLFEIISHISKQITPDIKTNIAPISYASRSDCVAFFKNNINIILAGIPTLNRHYYKGIPKCSIVDIVNLSRFLTFGVLKYYKNRDLFKTEPKNQSLLH